MNDTLHFFLHFSHPRFVPVVGMVKTALVMVLTAAAQGCIQILVMEQQHINILTADVVKRVQELVVTMEL
jgi:hypothetical protein